MERRPQEKDRRTGIRLEGDRVPIIACRAEIVAPRPDQCRAVFSLERRNRPHHVDEIFELAGRAAPHILVPVGELRWRARMQFERLREVELDGITPRVEDRAHQPHDGSISNKVFDSGHALQEPAEALGAWTIEAALTKGCAGKARIEGAIDLGNSGLGLDVL